MACENEKPQAVMDSIYEASDSHQFELTVAPQHVRRTNLSETSTPPRGDSHEHIILETREHLVHSSDMFLLHW